MSVWTKSENESGKAREVITGMKKSTILCDGQIDRQTDMNSYGCAVNTYYRQTMTITVTKHVHLHS